MKWGVLVLMMVLMVPIGHASVIEYTLTVDTETPEKRTVSVDVTEGRTEIPLLESYTQLDVDREYSMVTGGIAVDSSENDTVQITYMSYRITNQIGERALTVSLRNDINTSIESFVLKAKLPEGDPVKFNNGTPVMSPPASLTSDGERIIVTWIDEFPAGESKTFFAAYQSNESRGMVPFIIIILLFIVSVFIMSRWSITRKSDKSPESNAILTDDEEKIMSIVDHYGDKTLQSDIVRETKMSKAKISKIIRSIETKGVIEKKPYGKTNIIRRKR